MGITKPVRIGNIFSFKFLGFWIPRPKASKRKKTQKWQFLNDEKKT